MKSSSISWIDHLVATHGLTRRNLLIPAAGAFAAGIAWTRLGPLPADPPLTLAIVAMAGALLALWRWQPASSLLYPPLALFFFLLGMLHAGPGRPPAAPHHIYNLIPDQREGTILGRVRQTTRADSEKHRLLIEAEHLILPDRSHPATGLVQLSTRDTPPADLLPGDRLLVRATLDRPRSFRNPGAFDYPRFLADQGLWITGYIRSPAHLMKVGEPSATAGGTPWRSLAERLRRRISLSLDPLLPDDNVRGLYKAILIGERGDIPAAQTEDFNASGLTHLLSISGMHMSMLALLIIALFTWLLKRSTYVMLRFRVMKLAACLALPILSGYALITGLDPPVIRALVMTGVFLLAVLIDRQHSVPTNIALAAFLLLLWQPTSLFSVSFQLSFCAVIAMALALPLIQPLTMPPPAGTPRDWRGRLKRFPGLFWAGILISLVALLGTAPLTIFHFNRFSLLSPFTTLLVGPLVCYWSLPLGLLAVLLLPIAPVLALKLFTAGSWGLSATAGLARFAGSLPMSSVWLPTPSLVEILLWYGFLLALLGWKRNMFFRLTAAGCLLVSLAVPLALALLREQAPTTTVTYLDVGQGSATLLELPHGKTILIDGGGAFSEKFNVGQGVIAPYLWSKRITKLDSVVITHLHADHYNGLPFIVSSFKPKTLWLNDLPAVEPDPLLAKLMASVRDHQVRTVIPQPHELLFDDGRVSLRLISDLHLRDSQAPAAPRSARKDKGPNDSGLVLKLRHGDQRFLFPGDIEAGDERRLLAEGIDVGADILLAPHHGRATSSSPAFIAGVGPRYVVVSTGASLKAQKATDNRTAKYEEAGCQVFSTARDGAVSVRTDGTTLKITRAAASD